MDNSSLLRLVSPLSPTTRQTTRAIQVHTSDADPDLGSNAFLAPGSVIRIRNPGCKKIRIRDENYYYFSESFGTIF
jgi:hypothetical protein